MEHTLTNRNLDAPKICFNGYCAPQHRDATRRASSNSTVITSVFTGRPARTSANRVTLENMTASHIVPEFPLAVALLAPLQFAAAERSVTDFSTLYCGQTAALSKKMAGKR